MYYCHCKRTYHATELCKTWSLFNTTFFLPQERKSHTRFTSIFRKRRNASRRTYAAASCAGATTDDTTSITTPSATVAPSAAAAADDARRAARRTSLKAERTATTRCDTDNRYFVWVREGRGYDSRQAPGLTCVSQSSEDTRTDVHNSDLESRLVPVYRLTTTVYVLSLI